MHYIMKKINSILSKMFSAVLWFLTGGDLLKKRKETIFPSIDNHLPSGPGLYTHREMVKNLAVTLIY